MMKVNQMTSCRNLFNMLRMLPLPSIDIYETLLNEKTNLEST